MSDLWERLQRAKTAPVSRSAEAEQAEPAPEGWSWAAPLVARRTLEFPFDPDFAEAVAPDLEAWRGTLCLDVEATGLSGTAGTTAFLIGWAEIRGNGVQVTQWLLRDHPGERALVDGVDAELRSARHLVSFNGASYDLPLLRSRWTLNGRTFPDVPHRDDLHPARRLWKRLLESCRLARLEQTVLGIERRGDVGGALVPELWFAYLRSGAPAGFDMPLDGVLRHHAQDVYSLLCLDLLLAAVRRDPGHERWRRTFGPFPSRESRTRPAPWGLIHPDLGPATPVDFWGATEAMDDAGREDSLHGAWDELGSEAVGLAWAARLKEKGDAEAPRVWTVLWERSRSYPALLELLKWLEHRVKTPESFAEALSLVAEAFQAPFLPKVWRESLETRRARLERKIRGV